MWKIQILIIRTQKTGEKSGLVVRAEGSCPRGHGFESRLYWMDVSHASYYIFNEKGNKKVAKWGTPKKYEKKISENNHQ
jgi:hypothetical protein